MDWSNRFTRGGFTVTYSSFLQGWKVIKEKDGMEVSYRWFPTKEKAEAFAMNKLSKNKSSTFKQAIDLPPLKDPEVVVIF